MEKRKILLIVASLLFIVGICICFIVSVVNSFNCDCTKNDECNNIKENKEENTIFEGTIIDMEKKTVYQVSFEYDVVESLDTSLASLDLAILGKYLLVIDSNAIWFDSFDGYAMYHNNIVGFDDKTLKILESVIPVKKSDCCSCCPDLQPGESCIALCCSCDE